MWWTPSIILPYQRNFNFINSERSIGKTYNTQLFLLKKAIKENKQFVSLYRTKKEIENKKRFYKHFEKVVREQFTDTDINFDTWYCTRKNKYATNKTIILGQALAISDAVDIKQETFSDTYFLLMEEYMLEQKGKGRQTKQYVNGWDEPNLVLNIYHTVDRESDRVICFFLGNNTAFYNPYHMHPAFNIPYTEKGCIWTSENVLFQWAVADAELKEKKSKCKFLKMIESTQYGEYAVHGDYIDDNYTMIEKMTTPCRYLCTIQYMNNSYGVFSDTTKGKIYISDNFNPNYPLTYALTLDDHSENTLLTRASHSTILTWIAKNFKLGNLRYTSMKVKIGIEQGIRLIL